MTNTEGSEMMVYDRQNEEFQKTLPCESCPYNKVCKHYGKFETINIPSFFKVEYTCLEREAIENAFAKKD